MAVPGNMGGAFEIYHKLGSLPFKILAEPAIEMAKNGITTSSFQHYDFKLLEPIIAVDPAAKPVFFRDEKIIEEGDTFYMPQFADLMEVLVKEGQREFYEGEVVKSITTECREKGGYLVLDDFKNYQVGIGNPLSFFHRNKEILTNPPPSAGGTLIALTLFLLENEKKLEKAKSKEALLQLQKVLEKAEKIRNDEAAFNDFQSLIIKNHNTLNLQELKNTHLGSTTNFSIMDEHGNALAITVTNGQGAGFMIPGTDIMMNNMLGEGALFPHGFHSWEENTRVPSLVSPSVILNDDSTVMAVLGTGGAGRIPFSIMQVLTYLIDHGIKPEEAIQSPRVYWEKGTLNIEPGFEDIPDFGSSVKNIIQWEKQDMFFGGVHTIINQNGEIFAIPDHRREGVVKES